MKTLLTGRNPANVSDTFEIGRQITIVALGLAPTDVVTVWLVLLTKPVSDPCSCPPGQVQLPGVLDEQQLTCCDTPVTLTRARPFVVLDAPQGIKRRVKIEADTMDTQWVGYDETTSVNIDATSRGCLCAAEPEGEPGA